MIGNRIKESREKAGFTQDEFCLKINKSKRTLLNYEKNESEPTVTVALNIAKICNVDEIWLLTGESQTSYINYKVELIKYLEKLNDTQIEQLYHIAKKEAQKVKDSKE